MKATFSLWATWQARIKEIFPQIHGHQAKTLAWFSMGIVLANTVVLHRVGLVYRRLSATKVTSHVRRLERFLANPQVTMETHWLPALPYLLESWRGKSVQLILDASPLNGDAQVYQLGLVYQRRILPLTWRIMPSQTKWTESQWEMLRQMFEQVKPYLAGISCTLLADRGLGCRELAELCLAVDWHYLLRIVKSTMLAHPERSWIGLGALELQPGDCLTFATQIGKQQPFPTLVTCGWQVGYEEPWYLISDLFPGTTAMRLYARRMRIEAFFADAKRRGWDWTMSHVTDRVRLNRFLIALALAWWWSCHLGACCCHHGHRTLFDRHDRSDRSLLQLGHAWLEEALFHEPSPATVARLVPFFHRFGRLCFSMPL